jgi:hypothetical protein
MPPEVAPTIRGEAQTWALDFSATIAARALLATVSVAEKGSVDGSRTVTLRAGNRSVTAAARAGFRFHRFLLSEENRATYHRFSELL